MKLVRIKSSIASVDEILQGAVQEGKLTKDEKEHFLRIYRSGKIDDNMDMMIQVTQNSWDTNPHMSDGLSSLIKQYVSGERGLEKNISDIAKHIDKLENDRIWYTHQIDDIERKLYGRYSDLTERQEFDYKQLLKDYENSRSKLRKQIDEYREQIHKLRNSSKQQIESSKSDKNILAKIEKICKKISDKVVDVDYAYKGYTQTEECVLVELDSEDEYEARKIEYKLEDLPEVNSASVVDYYEISEDSYDDLDPDIRDTKVITVWLNKEE